MSYDDAKAAFLKAKKDLDKFVGYDVNGSDTEAPVSDDVLDATVGDDQKGRGVLSAFRAARTALATAHDERALEIADRYQTAQDAVRGLSAEDKADPTNPTLVEYRAVKAELADARADFRTTVGRTVGTVAAAVVEEG